MDAPDGAADLRIEHSMLRPDCLERGDRVAESADEWALSDHG